MSTIAVDNARPSAGGTSYSLTSGVAKAALYYDQTGPTINSSENISSVTDIGTGLFSPNLTNAMSGSADYQITTGCVIDLTSFNGANRTVQIYDPGGQTASSFKLAWVANGAVFDKLSHACVVGDLA